VQRRKLRPVVGVGEPQGTLELRRRLAVRAQRRRAPGGLRGMPRNRLLVPGALGVVRQQGRIGVLGLLQHGQQAGVQFGFPVRGDRRGHRHPDQLMPESQPGSLGDQEPATQTLVNHRVWSGQHPG